MELTLPLALQTLEYHKEQFWVPLLFLLFINDLPDIVKSNARLFADDCLLYRVINSKTDQLQLQEDLTNLEKWEKRW